MEQNEFIVLCRTMFADHSLTCSEKQAMQLHMLTERMLDVNRHMNLTAIVEERAIILRHYIDSLLISEPIAHGAHVIDIGCGAGFPTLPLAIFRPDLQITALDGTAKRIAYVSETARQLQLKNVTAIAGRAEEYAHRAEYRETFDIVTARAVASLPVLCELCLPFVRVGGMMLAMKSKQAEEELSEAENAIRLCGGMHVRTEWQTLSSDIEHAEKRALIFICKESPTSPKYPRHFSQISKKKL